MDFINENIWAISASALGLLEVILRVVPTGKSYSILKGVIRVVDFFVPDRFKK
jgi:hypothetical protein